MMGLRDVLSRALGGGAGADAGALVARLRAEGAEIVMIDDMADAVHGAFCGAEPDHAAPSEKDRHQADVLMRALYRRAY